MGLTQHEHAVGTIQQIVNLALLRGAIGKPGGGLCPVRGTATSRETAPSGIWERPTEAFLDGLGRRSGSPLRGSTATTWSRGSGDARG
jgi:anaerobic selenocysteine-containing dehydrogenase